MVFFDAIVASRQHVIEFLSARRCAGVPAVFEEVVEVADLRGLLMIARLLVCLLALIWVEVSCMADSIGVSVIQLIATPERFDGKRVWTIGFLKLEFEENALYLHRQDYDRAISKNALWIDTTPQKPGLVSAFAGKDLNDQYVIVEGVFDAMNTGHMGMFSGAIKEISRADRWQDRAEIEKILQDHNHERRTLEK